MTWTKTAEEEPKFPLNQPMTLEEIKEKLGAKELFMEGTTQEVINTLKESIKELDGDPESEQEMIETIEEAFYGDGEKIYADYKSYKYVVEIEAEDSALVFFSDDKKKWIHTGVQGRI